MSVAFRRTTATAYTVATPSGWTLIETQDNSATAPGMYGAVFWRFRGAETSVTVTASIGTLMYATAVIHAYRGDIDPVNPIDVSNSTVSNTTTTNKTVPSVTTTSAYSRLATFVHIWKTSTSAHTYPTPLIKQQDFWTNSSADMGASSGDGPTYATAATGTFTVNTGALSSSAGWFASIVAIRSGHTTAASGKPDVVDQNVNVGFTAGTINSQSWDYPISKSGDLMLMSFYIRASAGLRNSTTPSGWTLLQSHDDTASTGAALHLYWRIRGSETAVTTTTSGSAAYHSVILTAIDGNTVEPTTPIVDKSISPNIAGSTNLNAASVTATSNNTVVLSAHYDGQGGARTVTWGGGATETSDTCVNNGYYRGLSTALGYPSPGAIAYTCTSNSSSTYRAETSAIAVQPVQNLTQTVSDTGTAAESVSIRGLYTVLDSASGIEAAGIRLAATDLASAAESAYVQATVTPSDTGAAAETASVRATIPVADAGTASESAYVINVVQVSDSGTAAETARVTIYAADYGTFVDLATGIGQDSGSFTELSRVIIPVSDAYSASESAYSSQSLGAGDAGTATESATVGPKVADTGSAAESVSVRALVPLTDSGVATESARIRGYAADTGTATESAKVIVRGTDTGSAAESVTLGVTIFATDSGTAVESAALTVHAADSGHANEYQFRLISGLLIFPRQIKIPDDDRLIMIEPEPRRISIDPDWRSTNIRREIRRTIAVPADSRGYRIDAEG
jgi:hypothetical protein